MNDMRSMRSNNDVINDLKVPPHAIEAEKAVLGGLLLVSSAWDKVASRIAEEDFYHKNHQHIFRAIAFINENQQACDARFYRIKFILSNSFPLKGTHRLWLTRCGRQNSPL